MRVLGADPGARGAIALLDGPDLIEVHDMPMLLIERGKKDKAEVDGYGLAALLRELRPDVAFVEQVGGIEGQAAGAAFNFGRAAGAIEYSLKTLGVRVDLVAPVRWKRDLRVTKGKDGSRSDAMRYWPAQAGFFRRKMDNDRAEAALIARWGQLQLGEQTDASIFE